MGNIPLVGHTQVGELRMPALLVVGSSRWGVGGRTAQVVGGRRALVEVGHRVRVGVRRRVKAEGRRRSLGVGNVPLGVGDRRRVGGLHALLEEGSSCWREVGRRTEKGRRTVGGRRRGAGRRRGVRRPRQRPGAGRRHPRGWRS